MHTLGSPVHTGQLCMDQKVKETCTHQAALPETQSTLPGTQSFWSGNTLGPVCAHPDYSQPAKMVWHTVYTEATLSRVGDTEFREHARKVKQNATNEGTIKIPIEKL